MLCLTRPWLYETVKCMESLTSFLISVAGSLTVAMLVAVAVSVSKHRGEPFLESLFGQYFEKASKSLRDGLDELAEKADEQSKQIGGLQTSVANLDARSAKQSKTVGGLQSGVVALSETFGEQIETIGGLQSGVSALGASFGKQSEKIGGLQSGVVTLSETFGEQIETIGGLQSGVSALGASFGKQTKQIEDFKAMVRDTKSQVARVDQKVDDLIVLELRIGDARKRFEKKYSKPHGGTGDGE